MTYQESETLKAYVAQHSPLAYACTIRDRNSQLLAILQHTLTQNTKGTTVVPIGCPHCIRTDYFRCAQCIWCHNSTKYMVCCDVQFNRTALAQVNSGSCISISYSHNTASVNVLQIPKTMTQLVAWRSEYDNCRRFLEGHIKWSHRKDWGSKLSI